jgi:predicted alpha/beta-fold hydrolase
VKLSIANEQEKQPVIPYERQILDMPDGGIVSLDWALPPRENGSIPSVREVDPDKRTMIILPGLTGGSGELYIRNTVAQLLDHGWQVVVMNARGCANTPLKTAHVSFLLQAIAWHKGLAMLMLCSSDTCDSCLALATPTIFARR